ncbi:MAG: DUF4249 domain-containing protein [bacterium]
MRLKNYHIVLVSCFSLLFGCVEEIDLNSEAPLESVLVVEGTITNELKFQEIRLSRSYELESDGPAIESNANVVVNVSDGNSYSFTQNADGVYTSTQAFAAIPNVQYELTIQTSDGKQYFSTEMTLTTDTGIDNLYLERGLNENDDEGIGIFVDAFDPTGTSQFYRYTYEETYKIIAPFWVPQDLVVVSRDPPFAFTFELKEEEQQICFGNDKSTEIIIENTNDLVEDRVDGFRVRFINRNNYIMSHRYSILVTQFVQSPEAHEFYRTLKELSTEDNIFSNTQPGLLLGNIRNSNDITEPVAGFFEVVSTDSARIYFNYADEFPGEPLPPYVSTCGFSAPDVTRPFATSSPLIQALDAGFKYYSENDGSVELANGPYFLVESFCGNCTVLGSNVQPDFWEE